MIKTEFGIMDDFDPNKEYSKYEPEKYNCVFIDDDEYINDWWDRLLCVKTYNMSLDRPQTALSRWGITLIPPQSLAGFPDIVTSDRRISSDGNLVRLAELIRKAADENKYMIHFGV